MSNPFITISLSEMDAMEFPPNEWAVEGIIPTGALVVLAGRAKSGKSLLMLDMGLSIALGEPFLDRATRQTGVLYVPMEDHPGLVRDRVHIRLRTERNAPFYILPADGSYDQSLRLDGDGTGLERLIDTIDALDVGVVILDPLRELHTGKENDSDHMAVLLRPLRQLAHAKRVTIILTHHRNKYGTDASTAVRGSTAITGSVDQVITLTVNGEDDDLTPGQTVTLRAEGRYGPRQKIVARLGTGLRWEETDAEPLDRSLSSRTINLVYASDHVMVADAIATALNAKLGSVQNVLKQLVERKKMIRLGKGTKASPYGYARPGVTDNVTKGDASYDESAKQAHDESHDEYFPVTQGEIPMHHLFPGDSPLAGDDLFSLVP